MLRRGLASVELRRSEAKLLLALVRNHGRLLAADEVARELWPARGAGGVRGRLQQTAFRLRNAFEQVGCSRGVLGDGTGCYELRIDARCIDVLRFQRLARAGAGALAGGSPAWARETLAAALDLWREPAFGDEPAARRQTAELDQCERATRRRLARVLVSLGEHDEAIDVVGRSRPTDDVDEELVATAMVALERSGRAQQALRLYRGTYLLLRERSGLAPGAALRAVEHAVLSRDTSGWPAAQVAHGARFRVGEPVTLLATAWSPSPAATHRLPSDTELALEIVQRGGVPLARDAGLVAAFRFRSAALESMQALAALRMAVDGSRAAEALYPSCALTADGRVSAADVEGAALLAEATVQRERDGMLLPMNRHARSA